MADWATISSLATAAGTLVLAVATFASVRSANRSMEPAQRALELGLRPLLMPSRLEDATQKIQWGDHHWAHVDGGCASVELAENGNVYLAMSVRNAGTGIAVLRAWLVDPHPQPGMTEHRDIDHFRPHIRDLYIPAGDTGFWQGAIRCCRSVASGGWPAGPGTSRSTDRPRWWSGPNARTSPCLGRRSRCRRRSRRRPTPADRWRRRRTRPPRPRR